MSESSWHRLAACAWISCPASNTRPLEQPLQAFVAPPGLKRDLEPGMPGCVVSVVFGALTRAIEKPGKVIDVDGA